MSNSVCMLPVDIDLLLQLVHGPVRDVLEAVLSSEKKWPPFFEKLGDIRNRVLWLYAEPVGRGYIIPHVYDASRPFVMWRWSLEEHRNEADVCIQLLEHVDCLNNHEASFYRDIAVSLLKATTVEQLTAICDRLNAVIDSVHPLENKEPDWNEGKIK